MRGAKDFVWGPKQATTFDSLKTYLSEMITLTSPDPAFTLLLYIAASHSTISAALVQGKAKDGKLQKQPIYLVSEVLNSSKCNMMEI
jgi:hypothetical protein